MGLLCMRNNKYGITVYDLIAHGEMHEDAWVSGRKVMTSLFFSNSYLDHMISTSLTTFMSFEDHLFFH